MVYAAVRLMFRLQRKVPRFYFSWKSYSGSCKVSCESLKTAVTITSNLSVSAKAAARMETGTDVDKADIFRLPCNLEGMKVLDRDAFTKNVKVPCIYLLQNQMNSLKKLKKFMLKIRQCAPVRDVDGKKQILLNPDCIDDVQKLVDDGSFPAMSWTELTLKYENWNYDAILKAIIPQSLGESISSFSIIGHIIHLNLKPHLEEYKHIIGEVLLDKFSNITTVVNKKNSITKAFRNFEMEVLAGEPKFEVSVKENGLRYEFDFSKVFWNPRLGNERATVTNMFNAGDIVFDVFAGVGPFAIPAAKKKCQVYANDLNPDSYMWLCRNIRLNKVSDRVSAYNMDGHAFISTEVKERLSDFYSKEPKPDTKIYILMNLPAAALEFVSSFKYLLDINCSFPDTFMPVVHCYFFVKSTEDSQTIIQKHLDEEMQNCIKDVVQVRDVAPNKQMYRVTFSIPSALLFQGSENTPKLKRIKLDEARV